MSVLNFDTIECQKYIINGSEYELQKPIYGIVDKVENLVKEMTKITTKDQKIIMKTLGKSHKKIKSDIQKGIDRDVTIEKITEELDKNINTKGESEKLIKIQIQILSLILIGDVSKFTVEDYRYDIANKVLSDFFLQFKSTN